LYEVGSLLIKHFRGEDIPCRYGGDEFIVVLPDAPYKVTLTRAESFRENLNHFHIQNREHDVKAVTISMGIANFPMNGITAPVILKAADNALYRAKREGRNRVVVAA
jgi:diguanylate cyclase (GGDEF)-like protein